MKLVTDRLILRDIEPSDAKSLIKNINNLNISKWLLIVPYPYRKSDAEWYINHCQEGYAKHPRESYNFSIQLKDQEGIIGGLGIAHLDRKEKTGHIGYWVGEDYWRQGYVREACNRLLDYGFNTLKLREVTIPVFEKNIPSANMAQRLGGKYQGIPDKLHTCRATGKKHREKVYIVTPTSWKRSLRR